MNQSRDDLIALARLVLQRVYRERTPQALVMSVDPQHGITIHTTPVGVVAPPDGWLLRFEVDPSVLQAPSHVYLLAMLLVDSAIETAEKRRIADQLLADLRKSERLRLPEESDTMSKPEVSALLNTSDTSLDQVRWNPRYAVFARAHGRTPEDQAQFDETKWPGGCMVGFQLWISQQLREAYAASQGSVFRDLNGLHVWVQSEWDVWLNRPNASRIPDDPLVEKQQ